MTNRDNLARTAAVIPIEFAGGQRGPLRMSAREAGAVVRAMVADLPPDELLALHDLLTSHASLRSLAAASRARRSP